MAPNGRLARLHAHLSRSSDDATMALAAASAEAQADPLEMTPTEKFMFDLQGYLVIENFLSQDEVAALNDAFDANWDRRRIGDDASKRRGYDQFYGMLEWPQPFCQPFRDLLVRRPGLPRISFAPCGSLSRLRTPGAPQAHSLPEHDVWPRLEGGPRAVSAHGDGGDERGARQGQGRRHVGARRHRAPLRRPRLL